MDKLFKGVICLSGLQYSICSRNIASKEFSGISIFKETYAPSMLRYVTVFFFLCVFSQSNAQTKTIERLKENIQTAKKIDEKLKAVFALCDQGYSLHPDTLMSYAEQAKNIAIQQNNKHDEAEAIYYESYALTNKGLIDSSLNMAKQCLAMLDKKINDRTLLANLWNQQGRCFMRKNQYKEAIDMGYKVIGEAEKANDTLMQIKGKTLIGWAYLEMGQSKEALAWHLKALRTTNDTNLVNSYSILFANLAINYNGLGNLDSALYYIKKAVFYSREYESLFALSNSLAIEAQIYVGAGQSQLAEEPLKETVEIRKLIGDPFYIVSDMSQLALYYAHNGQPQKGIALCEEGIEIARKYKLGTKLFLLYTTLGENYKAMNNMPMYAQTLEKIITLKDSIYQNNSADALAEMQTKYDVQKKENIIIQQKLDLISKNYQLYGTIALLVFALIISYLLFKNYKRKQSMKLQLMQQEEKLKAEKAVTEAQEAERKRIAADLHDNLGAYAASIVANIDQLQASQIQIHNPAALQELRTNSQSIVAQLSDTIWALKKDSLSLTAISDRIKTFIQRIQLSYPDVVIDVIEHINNDHLLSPLQAFHLFRIVQEAINNALKHSHCKHLVVVIDGEKFWKISINDDGKGMMHKVNNSSGYGLVNMQKRSEESGWNIEWHTNNPKGTSVIIQSN